MVLDIVNVHFHCTGSQNLGVCGGCFSRLRSRCGAVRILVHGGHFSWQAQGKPSFGASKSTFRDRCKGSELCYFEMEFLWQVQHFGHVGDRRGAQIS